MKIVPGGGGGGGSPELSRLNVVPVRGTNRTARTFSNHEALFREIKQFPC
jgi:hypothetical protein